MDNRDILNIAMEQSAYDLNCEIDDFLSEKNVIVPYKRNDKVKKYYEEPIICSMVSYGNNIVAAVRDDIRDIVEEYLGKFEFYHCFEVPNMHWLNERLEVKGYRICYMSEYYLPDMRLLKPLKCEYELKLLEQKDFTNLYKEEWSNALCEKRKELDVLGVGAYDNEKLAGLAGCSADADKMLQIGVDVLTEYRRKGIAASLTSTLALEIIKRDKVPFYCTAWSNIRSVKNAVKSGFIPTWIEMSVKPVEEVNKLNKG
ncbi:MAG: GNAT family N-acetyltransferase [Lachnospiraceae bacterium]|nr:GNAT family N-acetyltransferase [Lachnospiraceae bacterium]